jgi:hypothetical protein
MLNNYKTDSMLHMKYFAINRAAYDSKTQKNLDFSSLEILSGSALDSVRKEWPPLRNCSLGSLAPFQCWKCFRIAHTISAGMVKRPLSMRGG